MTQISAGDSNSTVLMKPCAKAPITAAGRKAMRMPSAKFCERLLEGRLTSTCQKRWK